MLTRVWVILAHDEALVHLFRELEMANPALLVLWPFLLHSLLLLILGKNKTKQNEKTETY